MPVRALVTVEIFTGLSTILVSDGSGCIGKPRRRSFKISGGLYSVDGSSGGCELMELNTELLILCVVEGKSLLRDVENYIMMKHLL